jgi:hypothetical protein
MGFPLGGELRGYLFDRGPVHMSSMLGGAYWFYTDHHAYGPRAGVELSLDFGDSMLTLTSRALQVGFYARGAH